MRLIAVTESPEGSLGVGSEVFRGDEDDRNTGRWYSWQKIERSKKRKARKSGGRPQMITLVVAM